MVHGIEHQVIDDLMAEIFKKKSKEERLRIANNIHRSARIILRGAIQTQHPDWTLVQINQEIAQRIRGGILPNEYQ